ncbi:MAG: aminotransferase class I/II-fold pyridoxal phosphate-dependent enzyme [Bacteroidota bacterium]
MIEKIRELEQVARRLEVSPTQRHDWNQAVIQYADDFLDIIHERPAYIETDDKGQALQGIEVPEKGKAIGELLNIIAENVDRPGLNPASGGHLAYIPGGGLFPTALGDYLADVTNNYAGIFFGGPGAVHMENKLIRWMCSLVDYPTTALGNLTSGGSIANLIAIATARDARPVRARDIDRSVIYLTEQVHHSIQKAIRIAGMGEAPLRYIPVDDRFRMDVEALKTQIAADKAEGLQPFLLVASAGTTDTGAIDPLDALADVAEEENLWFHIDAAYGGFFILCDDIKKAYKGVERSDSFTIDPHKGLFLAYGTGAVLIKNVEALQNTHYYTAAYMQDTVNSKEELSPADLSPELTKHFRGMRMWLPLQLFGLEAFRAALEEKMYLCRYFHGEIKKRGFEVGPEPELSVCIYRYLPEDGDPNQFNTDLVNEVRADGRVFLSSTTINGVVWLRLAVLCFRSHMDTIQTCLQVLDEKVELLKEKEAYKKSTSTA